MNLLVLGEVSGGVVLFLVGMQSLSAALRTLAGDRLRRWLNAATASSARGLALGTSLGFLVHSSAATVMTVGLVNAGLLDLSAALPVLFGANVGTTLSMQIVSLRLTDYALVAVALGGVLQLLAGEGRWKLTGQATLGFGLLFLGMKIGGDAIVPYRDTLAPWLAAIDGSTLGGLVLGVALAALVTGVVQSSGAVIGMTFVLAGSGVFTSLHQTYPIVLGAHIGTTATALIASIGTNAEARRAAVANTAFNLFNAALGVAAVWPIVPFVEHVSGADVVRQTANAHTLVMVAAAVVLLPFGPTLARLVRRAVLPRAPEPARSFLVPALLRTPEDALLATIRELGRCAGLCVESFRVVNAALRDPAVRSLRTIAQNEASIDEIRTSVRAYLAQLSRGYLSSRQALLAQALSRCNAQIERIGDHVEHLAGLVRRGGAGGLARLDAAGCSRAREMADGVEAVVAATAEALATGGDDFNDASWKVIEARNAWQRQCVPVKAGIGERLARHEVPADLGLVFGEYAAALESIVRHCTIIAQEQRQPSFLIKPRKLGRLAGPGGRAAAAPPSDERPGPSLAKGGQA